MLSKMYIIMYIYFFRIVTRCPPPRRKSAWLMPSLTRCITSPQVTTRRCCWADPPG